MQYSFLSIWSLLSPPGALKRLLHLDCIHSGAFVSGSFLSLEWGVLLSMGYFLWLTCPTAYCLYIGRLGIWVRCFDTLSLREISFRLPHFFHCFSWTLQSKQSYFSSFFSNFVFSLNYFHQLESSKQNSSDREHSLVPESHGNFSCFQWLQMMLIFGLMDVRVCVCNFIMLRKHLF